MNKIVRTLVKKEILDLFRDRKTIIMMLFVPLILYPLIFVLAIQIMSAISSNIQTQTYNIAVNCDDGGRLYEKLNNSEEIDYSVNVIEAGGGNIDDYLAKLQTEEIDAYVYTEMIDGKLSYVVSYVSSINNSSYSTDVVEAAIKDIRSEMTRSILADAGLEAEAILNPITYSFSDNASGEQSIGSLLSQIIPFMLIISLLMGTMHPAIDLTAGEKERGTLETILTLPVTNRELIVSKFITVAIIGIMSAALNIISMGGIGLYMYSTLGELIGGDLDIKLSSFVPALIVTILAVLAFSVFISAVTMCITAFAKTYKEANNYITPLTMVVMFTGYIGFIPNIELNTTVAMIPVANICLLIKNLLLFKIDYSIVALVLLSNVFYGILAITFLSKIYDSESIMFGDGKGNLQLFEKRENIKAGGVPTTGDAWFVMFLTILLVIYLGGMLQIKFGIGGVFGTQMIILLVPLSLVLYTKRNIKETYSFKKTGVLSYVGGVIFMAGAFVVNLLLSNILTSLLPTETTQISETFEVLMDKGIGVSLLVIALAPAICEEMLFRGFLYSAMKNRYKAAWAIAIVAVLFGIYHMSFIKFFTTGFLGAVLCYTVYKTESIFPAMLMHFLNNAISVLFTYYPEKIGEVIPILTKESIGIFDYALLLAIGVSLAVIGIIILQKLRKGNDINGEECAK